MSAEKEPEIFNAIRYGSVLENTVQDPHSHRTDYTNTSITPNTRVSYPIEYIDNAQIPCVAEPARHIIFLTCDAFGVLPPVSKLTAEQAMYHFVSGYTAKVAGTEMGVSEPEATFSACFGAAFLVWHPMKYAKLLAKKKVTHGSSVWLVNTGWSGGAFEVGSRISLKYTRAIIDAIHNGKLSTMDYVTDPIFGLHSPKACPGVPGRILQPKGLGATRKPTNRRRCCWLKSSKTTSNSTKTKRLPKSSLPGPRPNGTDLRSRCRQTSGSGSERPELWRAQLRRPI